MPEVYVPLTVLAVLLLIYFALGFVIAKRTLFRKGKNNQQAIESERASGISEDEIFYSPSKTLQTRSKDNLLLSADLFLCKEKSDKWVITIHGYLSQNMTMAKYAKMFNDFGYNVLATELRNSGKSQGNYYSFGYKEKEDCLNWISFLQENFQVKHLGLFGISMGAATVIMTAEKCEKVDFVISYCSYSSFRAIITHQVGKQMGGFFKICYPAVSLASLILTGLKSWEIKPEKSIAGVKCPTLIMHSKKDEFTPYTQSVAIHQGNKNTYLHLFEEGRHARAYSANREEYIKTVQKFLEKVEENFSEN